MASPVISLPPVRSASRSRGIQRSPNPSRRDKVRQGKLIRCWTDEEESFLFRSRTQGDKLPYKHIARSLDKSELACRLHYHHMMVGRKGHGHQVEDFDDDSLSENSDGSSPSTVPIPGELPRHKGFDSAQQRNLPSFNTFLRHTFHQRSTSMPGSLVEDEMHNSSRDLGPQNANRPTRTLSGTWLREDRGSDAYSPSQPQKPADTLHVSRAPPTPCQSPSDYMQKAVTNAQPLTSAHGNSRLTNGHAAA